MAEDRFKDVRKHLRLAATSLTVSEPRTTALKKRVTAVEDQLDPSERASDNPRAAWIGSPELADGELERITAALALLKAPQQAVATGVGKLTQDGKSVLLPGVADALEQLESAVGLLKLMPEGE